MHFKIFHQHKSNILGSKNQHTTKKQQRIKHDKHQKPNTNRETKILNQKSNKKAKDTIQY